MYTVSCWNIQKSRDINDEFPGIIMYILLERQMELHWLDVCDWMWSKFHQKHIELLQLQRRFHQRYRT